MCVQASSFPEARTLLAATSEANNLNAKEAVRTPNHAALGCARTQPDSVNTMHD